MNYWQTVEVHDSKWFHCHDIVHGFILFQKTVIPNQPTNIQKTLNNFPLKKIHTYYYHYLLMIPKDVDQVYFTNASNYTETKE